MSNSNEKKAISLDLKIKNTFGENAKVNLQKSVSQNYKELVNTDDRKEGKKSLINGSKLIHNSLSNKLVSLFAFCDTFEGKEAIKKSGIDTNYLCKKVINRCFSYVERDGIKHYFKVVKKTENNTFKIAKEGDNLQFIFVDSKCTFELKKSGENSIFKIYKENDTINEYTFIELKEYTFSDIVNRLTAYKKYLDFKKLEHYKAENLTKAEKEKELLQEKKKAENLELKRIEKEKAEKAEKERLIQYEKDMQELAELRAMQAAKVENNTIPQQTAKKDKKAA
jgi:hypothetical protein